MVTVEDRLKDLRQQLEQHLLLRWTLANVVGWSAGLFLGLVFAKLVGQIVGQTVGSVLGVLLAGALTGTVAGWTQRWALGGLFEPDEIERRWVLLSVIGSTLGAASLLLTWFTLMIGSVGWAIMGAVFGLCFGWAQAPVLGKHFGTLAAVWVMANVLGGCACSTLSTSGNLLRLPICCTLGPVAFGVITGLALLALAHASED